MLSAKMKWSGGIKFEGTGVYGTPIITDGAKEGGGGEEGYKPTELLLFSIAGCTGVDVVKILEKQRQKVSSVEIEVVAHQPEDYPKPFNRVEIKYTVRGEKIDPAKLAKAIELSEKKYCVVSQTVKHAGEVTTSFEILPE